eukprot:140557-Prymnesium_polylepis.1
MTVAGCVHPNTSYLRGGCPWLGYGDHVAPAVKIRPFHAVKAVSPLHFGTVWRESAQVAAKKRFWAGIGGKHSSDGMPRPSSSGFDLLPMPPLPTTSLSSPQASTKFYDASNVTLFSILTCKRVGSTILPLVLRGLSFWLLLVFHVGCIIRREYEDTGTVPGGLVDHIWTAALMPSSLVTFLLVFYAGNCYQRYFELLGHCTGLGGAMQEAVMLTKSLLKEDVHRWNVVRLFLATNFIGFSILRSSDGCVEDDDWEEMVQNHLLSRSEVQALRSRSGFLPLFTSDWTLHQFRTFLAHQANLGDNTVSSWPGSEVMGYQLLQAQ